MRRKGKSPYWPENRRKAIQKAAADAGIKKRVGFHTFKHTLSSLLKENGEDVKVIQELLRHANSRTTLDTYTQAASPAKRAAQSRVVSMVLGKRYNQLQPAGTA